MAPLNHTHRYHRIDIAAKSNPPVWVMKCQDCSHYVRMKTKLSAPLLRGQISRCNRCDEKFILDKRALRMAEPCCADCVKTPKNKQDKIKSAEDFFSDLEKELGVK